MTNKVKQAWYQKNKKKIQEKQKIWRLKEKIKNGETKLESQISDLEFTLEMLDYVDEAKRTIKSLLTSKICNNFCFNPYNIRHE